MSVTQSDAFVFFGATGDLAYKKIFPALQAMIKRGNLTVPVIGVAWAGWGIEQLRDRVRKSIEERSTIDEAAFAKLMALLQYVAGDYSDPDPSSVCGKHWAAPSTRFTIWRFRPACSAP